MDGLFDQAVCRPRPGGIGEKERLEAELDALDSAAVPFGLRFIKDARARELYRESIRHAVAEIRSAVARGSLTPEEGAEQARMVRNELIELARSRSSGLGRAWAEKLKQQGL